MFSWTTSSECGVGTTGAITFHADPKAQPAAATFHSSTALAAFLRLSTDQAGVGSFGCSAGFSGAGTVSGTGVSLGISMMRCGLAISAIVVPPWGHATCARRLLARSYHGIWQSNCRYMLWVA